MNEISLAGLRASLDKYLSSIANTAKQVGRMAFNSAGLIPEGTIKEWYGMATSSNGIFTLDISSAGFTQILHVIPQAIYNSSDFNKQAHASLNLISLTSITGRVVTGATGVFKSDVLIAAPNVTVMVKVTGR